MPNRHSSSQHKLILLQKIQVINFLYQDHLISPLLNLLQPDLIPRFLNPGTMIIHINGSSSRLASLIHLHFPEKMIIFFVRIPFSLVLLAFHPVQIVMFVFFMVFGHVMKL